MGQTNALPKNSSVKADGVWTIQLIINNEIYTVNSDVSPALKLNSFIRDVAGLKGTKFMCLEGGCGTCIVSIETNGETFAVNSCLVPIYLCDGLKITTIEGIGSKKEGYNTLQTSLAHLNGTQCGYCTPGMIMNMYSLVKDKKATKNEIEKSFGGSTCRCTGYRPILDTFKSFASDASSENVQQIRDIEDLYRIKSCKRLDDICHEHCENFEHVCCSAQVQEPLNITFSDTMFFKIREINDIFDIFKSYSKKSYILHGGNTGIGVYAHDPPNIYIDINGIPELKRISSEKNKLVIGGGVTLANVKKAFEKKSKETGFKYLRNLANHIDLIANVPVRNIGTVAGNLMIKHGHHEFSSDLFLMLETAGSRIHILDSLSTKVIKSFCEFLNMDMDHKVIYSIELPILDKRCLFRSFKIMRRLQNVHAIVNAGFLFKIDAENKVLEKPNMIFGGMNPDFLHASKTEAFLVGKSIAKQSVVSQALKVLDSELKPNYSLPDTKPEFRKLLAASLFYKVILEINKDIVDEKLISGASILHRGLSSGTQNFDTDRSLWPENQPIPKLEALYQTSGEAEYVNDIPKFPNELSCAFAIADAPGIMRGIDSSEALSMPGVVAFFAAKDIPGKNIFTTKDFKLPVFFVEDEVLFAEKEISYAGQPIGMIVATSQNAATAAAKKVRIKCDQGPREKVAISIQDTLASNDKTKIWKSGEHKSTQELGQDIEHVIKGTFEAGGQYHYTMETQCCICIPIEDGMDVFATTQFMDHVQYAMSQVLNVPMNSINIRVRRLGGGYGAKLTRSSLIACACALACHILNVPVRFTMTMEECMKCIGKRFSTLQKYEIGVDGQGVIQYLKSTHWGNAGNSFNDPHGGMAITHLLNCYNTSTWNCIGYEVMTNLPSNTWCRAPGSCEGVAMAENMLEHIAKVTGKDPIEIRLANMTETDKKCLQPMLEKLKESTTYDETRKAIKSFNDRNRWKKKGIAVVCMTYPMSFLSAYRALISVYAKDGSVSITHDGIEMGQGINTKVAQIAAHTLGIDFDLITVKPTTTLTSPNDSPSGHSQASDACAYATKKACEKLLEKLEPIKKKMKDPTWKDILAEAYANNVDLCTIYMYSPTDTPVEYSIYGAAMVQVEVDVLTGQHLIQRADIIEDVGVSINPLIDVGQIEGAFVMGLGYWTCEELFYDPETGALTNFRSWDYNPPGALDIPIDFRIAFQRKSSTPFSVVRSKATGEPPLCMSYAVSLAIRDALDSARKDAGLHDAWYPLSGPVTTEKILLASGTNKEAMTF